MPEYARVLHGSDPEARRWVGTMGLVVAVQQARGYSTLLLLESPTGQREVFRASEVALCLCACNCGQPVGLITHADTSRGLTAGEPRRYVRGHHGQQGAFLSVPTQEPNPSGVCLCGCGQLTSPVRESDFRRGYRRGWYARFCVGHDLSRRPPQLQCLQGHALTGDNVYVHLRGGQTRRDCRTCRRAREHRWRARRAEAAAGSAASA